MRPLPKERSPRALGATSLHHFCRRLDLFSRYWHIRTMTVPGEAAPRAANVFLIGPMGAGKSTIGHYLAELLHKEFLDADHEIEARTGASIPLIFEIEGEAGFRRRESSVLDDLTRKSNLVLATGGGAILSDDNRRALRTRGVVVYMHAPLETLLQRTRRDRHRPLLQ